jgi:malate permease and related proteins
MHLSVLKDVFLSNLLPILLAASTGFVVGKTLHPDIRSVSRLTFYIFSPCLVFILLVRAGLKGAELESLAIFSVTVSILIGFLAFSVGKVLRAGRQMTATLVVSSVLSNGGNYGLAANRFAFGEAALARATVLFVLTTMITYTAGILVSSMGKLPAGAALRKLFSVPAFYALICAGFLRFTGWGLPTYADRAVSLLAEAAIPMMLVLLGLQLAAIREWPRGRVLLIGVACLVQLVITPLVAILLAGWMGLSGPAKQAAVLQFSMPAAVVTTVLAVEYDLDTMLVTGTLLVTTLMSPLTLTPIIAYLLSSS